MDRSDKKTFSEVMTGMAEVFDKPCSNAKIKIYFSVLEQYSIEDVVRAGQYLIRSNTFFPKPAEFISAIEGDPESRAAVAWATLVEAIEVHGHGKSVCFTDRAIMGAVNAMGGWQELCTSPDLKYRQKQFSQLYAYFSRPGREIPDHLPGLIETSNRLSGYLEEIQQVKPGRYTGSPVQVDNIGAKPNRPQITGSPVQVDYVET